MAIRGGPAPVWAGRGGRFRIRFGAVKAKKLIPLLVIAAGLLAYGNALSDSFVFDDHWSILENPLIRQLSRPGEILARSSRPLMDFSLALNYAMGGLNPWGYHAANIAIHILAALVLYGILRRTFLLAGPRSPWGASSAWLAGTVALIWVVHPLQTESVTYTVQRAESLMGLFYLLTLYCVIRGSGSTRGMGWNAAAVCSCLLGMASKEVMVTAPVVVLLYDRVFLAKTWREVLQRRWGLYAGLAATWLLLPVLMPRTPVAARWHPTAGFAYKGFTPLQYALTQPSVILHYLRLAFWPSPLCLDYGWGFGWPVARTVGEALPGLVVVGGLFAAMVYAWWRKPALGFLGAWFFLILAPTSSVVPIADLVFEHRMYLSLAAVVTLVVAGVFALQLKLSGARCAQGRTLGWGVGGVAVVLLAFLTIQRNFDYRSELGIWQDTVGKSPGNPRAHYNLGVALEQAGRFPEAFQEYEQAVRIKPDYDEAQNNLGQALIGLGRFPEAVEHLEQALLVSPDFVEAHCNLGNALLQVGRGQDAITHLEQAIRLKPDLPVAHYNLGNAFSQAGRAQEAIAQYEEALRIRPDYTEAHVNLGTVLQQAGRLKDAMAQYEQALLLRPDLPEAHYNLGYALSQVGQSHDAIGQLEQAMRLRPTYAEPRIYLAWLLATLPQAQGGDPGRAVTLAQQACDLTSNRVPAYLDILSVAESAAGRSADAIVTSQKALELARSLGQAQLAGQIETRLQSYRAGHAP